MTLAATGTGPAEAADVGPAEVEDTFVEAVPKEAGAVNDAAASAGQLLSQLGVSEETTGGVNQVRLQKVTVEIQLSDA